MKKAILVAIIGAMTLGVTTPGINAGDWGKAPVTGGKAPQGKAPIEECYDVGGEISAGYMSDYIFMGSRLARDTVWTDVNYTLNSIVPITIGATYFSFTNQRVVGLGTGDKLDLYASAAIGTFFGFDTTLGYTHYFFPGSGGLNSFGNINLDLRRSLGFADLLVGTNYGGIGIAGSGWYHHAGLEKTFGLTDAISLVLGAGIGYNDQYGGILTSGWSNYYVTAALPIELNCRATLTPYVGYNGGIAQRAGATVSDGLGFAGGGDVLHAGVSLNVSF